MVEHDHGAALARLGQDVLEPLEPFAVDPAVAGLGHRRVHGHDPEPVPEQHLLARPEHLLEPVREVVVAHRVDDGCAALGRPRLQPAGEQPVRRGAPVVRQVTGRNHHVHRGERRRALEHPVEGGERVDEPVLQAPVAGQVRVAQVQDAQRFGHAVTLPPATVAGAAAAFAFDH